MKITIRSTKPEDYPALVEIYNDQNEPHHQLTEDELRSAHERARKQRYCHHLTALVDGDVVGSGDIGERPPDNPPGKFWGWFFVRHDFQGEGIDTALWDEALVLLNDRDPTSLWTCVREDFVPSAGYLRERSYQEQFRSWGANLDLGEFEPGRFEQYSEGLRERGIELRTLDDLASHSLRDDKLMALQSELEEDVPYFEPIIPKRHPTIEDEEMLRESIIVAVHEDEFVGMASLHDSQPRFLDVAGCGLTGVKEGFRNSGVATALMVSTAAWAKDRGYREVNAGGAGTNAPILKVIRRLGFEVEPAWITLARFL